MRCTALLVNARFPTAASIGPPPDALAIRDDRIVAIGSYAELREMADRHTQIYDAEGGRAIPAFHDAHLHLLSFARHASRVDCSNIPDFSTLAAALSSRAEKTPPGAWVRAVGFDEHHTSPYGRFPDRWDLDRAVPSHPVRLRHRSQHLDVLNTAALQTTGLLHSARPEMERDPRSGEPTGRLFHAMELLREVLRPGADQAELPLAVRAASERLLAWGITTVQDASVTNGPAEWDLFQRLDAIGALGVRTYVFPGFQHWHEVGALEPAPSGNVRLGPVKIMLAETRLDTLDALRVGVRDILRARRSVAFHAVTEAEVAVALDLLTDTQLPRDHAAPNRLEHASVVPTDLLDDLAAAHVTVIGQPSSIVCRGDTYLRQHEPEVHAWLHRSGSFVRAGVPYAVGSDAPVGDPAPGLALYALRTRRTREGARLGPSERLECGSALAAMTLQSARAVGASDLGHLGVGALADIAVIDSDVLDNPTLESAQRLARLTIKAGRLVWRRPPAH